ncbi:uncharacterized protein LOC135849758 [Planococcus citri]|uniref:uncharacterized protein LOC135849758 n=1 Tax=Planococcus citri TaxID=170843 RepID=UPI0031F7926C
MPSIILFFFFCLLPAFTLSTHASQTAVNSKHVPDGNNTFIIGVSNFKLLLNYSNLFADKTLWIKEVLECNSKYIVITCPHKSGKSINLSMLKIFLEIEYKNDTYSVTENYKLFREGELHWNGTYIVNYSKPLLISQHTNILDQYQGKYPVIFLNLEFSYHVLGKRHDFGLILTSRIHSIYLQFPNICSVFGTSSSPNNDTVSSSETKSQTDKAKKCRIMMKGFPVDTDTLIESICILSEALYRRYNQKVFLLIDDYDGLLRLIMHYNWYSQSNITDMLNLYTTFLHQTLHKNDYIEKCVMTGVMHIYDNDLLPSSANLTVYDSLNNKWQEFFGFSEAEVDGMFNYTELHENDTDKGYKWFRGYNMNRDVNITIFNPWSITNFIIYELIHNYWVMAGASHFLASLVQYKPIRDIIEQLFFVPNYPVRFDYLYFTTEELLQLREIFFDLKNSKLSETTIRELVLKYLCARGFLTYGGQSYDRTGSGVIVSALRFPNNEVTTEWWKRLTDFYTYQLKIPDCQMLTWCQSIDSFIQNKTGRNQIIKHTREFFSKVPYNVTDIAYNETIQGTIRKCLSFRMRFQFNYFALIRKETDTIMGKDGRAAVLQIDYNAISPQRAFQKAQEYTKVFANFTTIKTVNFIGMAISPDKNVTVMNEIYDTNEITKADDAVPAKVIGIEMPENINETTTETARS